MPGEGASRPDTLGSVGSKMRPGRGTVRLKPKSAVLWFSGFLLWSFKWTTKRVPSCTKTTRSRGLLMEVALDVCAANRIWTHRNSSTG